MDIFKTKITYSPFNITIQFGTEHFKIIPIKEISEIELVGKRISIKVKDIKEPIMIHDNATKNFEILTNAIDYR